MDNFGQVFRAALSEETIEKLTKKEYVALRDNIAATMAQSGETPEAIEDFKRNFKLSDKHIASILVESPIALQAAIDYCTKIINSNLNSFASTDDELNAGLNEEYQDFQEMEAEAFMEMYEGASGRESKVLNVFDFEKLREAFEIKQKWMDYLSALSPKDKEQAETKIKAIAKILPGVEEMSILGRTLGINQGLKTNEYDIKRFVDGIERFVTKRFKSVDKKAPAFSLYRFMTDLDYQKTCIIQYEGVKTTYNILDTLVSVPHFAEMLKTTSVLDQALGMTCHRYAAKRDLDNKFNEDKSPLSREEFKQLDYYMNDMYAFEFIKELGRMNPPMKFTFPKGSQLYTSYMQMTPPLMTPETLNVDSYFVIGSIKHYMDSELIYQLQKDPRYADNKFIQSLVPFSIDKVGKEKAGYRLSLDMMETESVDALYTEILKDFNKIAHDSIGGMELGDLFFLYNLLLNRDAFGRDSLTKIFSDLVDAEKMGQKTSPLVKAYYQMVSDFDSGKKTMALSFEEANYRVSKAKGSKHTTKITTNVVNPTDFPLDLPKTADNTSQGDALRQTRIENSVKAIAAQLATKVSSDELLVTLANNINQRFDTQLVEVITTEDLVNDPKFAKMANKNLADAFILNGTIYMIAGKTTFGQAAHEIAHLVLASAKAQAKDSYYKLLSMVRKYDQYEKIADRYRNALGMRGSDVDEEVLCTIIGDMLDGAMHKDPSQLCDAILNTSSINNAFG